MSFIGFDKQDQKSYLRGHPAQAPGFGTAPDPFASISGDQDDDEAYASVFQMFSCLRLTKFIFQHRF